MEDRGRRFSLGLQTREQPDPHTRGESLFVLRKEVEEAVRSLKAGKSPEVDNIPSELLKNTGKATTTVLTAICQKIWESKEWPKEWTQSFVILLP